MVEIRVMDIYATLWILKAFISKKMNHQIKLFGEALPTSPYGTPYFWFDSLSSPGEGTFKRITDRLQF